MAGPGEYSRRQSQQWFENFSSYRNRISRLFTQAGASHKSTPPQSTIAENPRIIGLTPPEHTSHVPAESTVSPSPHINSLTTSASPSTATKPSQSAIEITALRLAQVDAEPGEFWLVVRDGWEPWPAVICDEGMVEEFFKKQYMYRVSSRRNDGTWGKKFRAHGELVSKRTFPALLLALNRCVWVPCHRLRPLDLQLGARKQNVPENKDLVRAYELAAEQKPLHLWKDILIVHRRRLWTGAVAKKDASNARRRPIAAVGAVDSEVAFRFPPGFEHDESNTEGDPMLLTPPPSTRKTAKRVFEDGMSPEDIKALYEVSGTEAAAEHSKKIKGKKLKTQLTQGRDPVANVDVTVLPSQESVKVYVDNPVRIVYIVRDNIRQSTVLEMLLSHDPDEGWFIVSPLLLTLPVGPFVAVAEFLDAGEYSPYLLQNYRIDIGLQDITTPCAKATQILSSAMVYHAAGKLQLRPLQDLALRKLRVLSPYPAAELLTVVDLIFMNVGAQNDVDIRQHLIKHLAENYENLQKHEPRRFRDLMARFPDLDVSVTARRAEAVRDEDDFLFMDDF